MIEQYFIPGLEFNWKAPPQPQPQDDGDFVEWGQYTPPRLCYAGIGSEIPADPSQMPAGLTNDFELPYVWLNYVVGRTAYVEPDARDVLTGFMSGCWICTWRWGQGG